MSRSAFKVISKLFKFFQPKPAVKPARRGPARAPSVTATGRLARGPERERDKVLAPQTRQWLKSLPPSARPTELAERYPRICNHLVMIWNDDFLMDSYLNNLLVDNRGGRAGFAPTIGAELIRLHVFYANTKAHPHAANAWDDRMLAVGDR